jgi:hypothetical protein
LNQNSNNSVSKQLIFSRLRYQERAQKSKHPVLNDWKFCKEGDIVGCLLMYYQVRYAMVVLLGKPVDESVITMQIIDTQWTVDTAAGRFEKYQELRDLHLRKGVLNAKLLMNELTTATSNTMVGTIWWERVKARMDFIRDMRAQSSLKWEITYPLIEECALFIRDEDKLREQKEARRGKKATGEPPGPGGASSPATPQARGGRLSRTLHALIQEGIDSEEFRQGGRSRSTSPAGSTGSQERYRQEFVLCSACACKHMEGAGPGVRPFRKTDSHAKVDIHVSGGLVCGAGGNACSYPSMGGHTQASRHYGPSTSSEGGAGYRPERPGVHAVVHPWCNGRGYQGPATRHLPEPCVVLPSRGSAGKGSVGKDLSSPEDPGAPTQLRGIQHSGSSRVS